MDRLFLEGPWRPHDPRSGHDFWFGPMHKNEISGRDSYFEHAQNDRNRTVLTTPGALPPLFCEVGVMGTTSSLPATYLNRQATTAALPHAQRPPRERLRSDEKSGSWVAVQVQLSNDYVLRKAETLGVLSPPPLPTIPFGQNDLAISRGCRRRQ